MDYQIAMNFITWVIAYFMIQGWFFLKSCEWFASDSRTEEEREEMGDGVFMGAQKLIDEYNSLSWFGRVHFVLCHGASLTAMSFKLKRKD